MAKKRRKARVKARKFWDIKNVLTTLKSYVAGLVSGLPLVLMVYLRGLIDPTRTNLMMLAGFLILCYGIFNLWFWGFLANKWFEWE